jgi:predicted ATPase
LLIDFLGFSEPGTQVLRLDPTTRRERLINLFRRLFRLMHSRFPYQAVTLLEDLHWMDDGSASLVELYAEMVQGTRLLMVVNYRPGFAVPWMTDNRYEQISLAPLGENAADLLASRLLGDDESVVPLLPLIADRALGNPLFIEELVRQLAESGHLAGEPGAYRLVRAPDMKRVPATVQAIIGTRIDSRPEKERSVLQTAAVIGREFSIDVLSRLVSGLTEELGPILQRLSSAGLIYESGASEGKFAFKHPMVQEVNLSADVDPAA